MARTPTEDLVSDTERFLHDAEPLSRSSPVRPVDGHVTRPATEPPAAAPEADAPVRFLDTTGEFSCPHCNETIRLEGVSLKVQGHDNPENVELDLRYPDQRLDDVVDEVRRILVTRALREADGVKVKAAEIVGMKYTTFYELVRRLGLLNKDHEE